MRTQPSENSLAPRPIPSSPSATRGGAPRRGSHARVEGSIALARTAGAVFAVTGALAASPQGDALAPSAERRATSATSAQVQDAKSAKSEQEPAPTKPPPEAGQEAKPVVEPDTTEPFAYPPLETIVISSVSGVPLKYPGGRDVIEPETLAQYPDASPATALRRVPGVYITPEGGNDSRLHIGIRGNDPRRSALTAVLVDGIPVCEAPYGNTDIDGLPIAFDRIWRMDVIRGGASLRYGPNSAGGVVNFLTEPVPDAPMLRFTTRIGSDNEFAEALSTGGTFGKFGVLASGVLKGGDGFRENSEYRDTDGALKLRYALGENETLSAYVSRFTELGAEQPGGLSQADYDEDPWQSTREGSDFTFSMNRYVLEYDNKLDAKSAFQLKAWFQDGYRELFDYRPIVQPYTQERAQESDFYSGALEARYSWATKWFGLDNSLYTSARYLTELNDEFYWRRPIGGGPYVQPYDLNAQFKGQTFSIFGEDVIALTDTLDWGVGLRVESIVMSGVSHDDDNQIVKDYSLLLPETNLTWNVLPRTAIYASYQENFYPPQYETGFDPASVLYAPTDPEHSDSYELGVRSREVDGLECSLALFDTEYSDKIEFINTPNGKVPVNSGDVSSRGVELGLDYSLGAAVEALEGFGVYGTVTAMSSKIESGPNEGNDSPNAPNLLGSWGLDYQHLRSGLWGRIGGSYSGDCYRDPANTPVGTPDGLNGPVPSFTLWDCALGWNQHPDRSGWSLTTGVTNLFEEEYFRRFATGIYPGAPRQYFAAVTYSMSF